MKNQITKIKKQANANIDFLNSKEGWNEVKKILTMTAFDMSKKQRKEFFELMKDENQKRNFLSFLFATTALEAAIIQQQ